MHRKTFAFLVFVLIAVKIQALVTDRLCKMGQSTKDCLAECKITEQQDAKKESSCHSTLEITTDLLFCTNIYINKHAEFASKKNRIIYKQLKADIIRKEFIRQVELKSNLGNDEIVEKLVGPGPDSMEFIIQYSHSLYLKANDLLPGKIDCQPEDQKLLDLMAEYRIQPRIIEIRIPAEAAGIDSVLKPRKDLTSLASRSVELVLGSIHILYLFLNLFILN
ncbi:hypothetical protein Ciccas_013040 [Cichlidogyrus casuarinus]|uniref:Uncharacterized protein n=1 Tax=Cichlidogyrus casuarinus TaxID=1844966 RepID=A0ABD2PLS0_9PLAT